MAQIKLSALASDMKGKLQGSVLAGGPGGLYVRNNPSGGGKKSRIWDKQKARLSSLAGQWRGLTIAQKQSWNDATALYPSTNKFGDPRLPSGYELFMQLNGNLQYAGIPLMTSPIAPRVSPAVSPMMVSSPDFKMIVPSRAFDFQTDQGNPSIPFCHEFYSNSDLSTYQVLSARFFTSPSSRVPVLKDRLISLFFSSLDNLTEYGLFVAHNSDGTTSFTARLNYADGEGNPAVFSNTWTVPKGTITESFHVSLMSSLTVNGLFSIWVNGVELLAPVVEKNNDPGSFFLYPFVDVAFAPSEIPEQVNLTGSLSIGDSTFTTVNYYNVSDFRFFENIYTAGLASADGLGTTPDGFAYVLRTAGLYLLESVLVSSDEYPISTEPLVFQLLNLRYYLESETAVVTFTQNELNVFPNEVDFLPRYEFTRIGGPAEDALEIVEDMYWIIYDNQNRPYPWLIGGAPDVAQEDMSLQLAGASSVSTGITNYTGKTRKFALIPLVGKASDISRVFTESSGLPAFNSDLIIQASLLDLQTGKRLSAPWPVEFVLFDLEGSTPEPNRQGVRFKAGSELSSRVN